MYRRAQTLALLAALACTGCEGGLLDPPAGPSGAPRPGEDPGVPGEPGVPGVPGEPGAPVCDDTLRVGTAPMRRLGNAEYEHTLRDLFPGVAVTLPELPPDTASSGFENDALSLGPSDVRVARWEEIAWRYASAVTATSSALASFLACAPSATDAATQHACAGALLDGFGMRAMRRPLAADERERYLALFEEQRAAIDFSAAIQLTVLAILQSPAFLYRIEVPDEGAAPGSIVALDGFEIASRLSYFLWESMPDAELLDAAATGALVTSEQIEAQARRMVADDRAREAVVDFHRQWLEFDRIDAEEHSSRVPALYPTWNETLRASVREEQDRFVEGTIFEGAGTLAALLTSRTTWVNASLARLYGVEGPADDATWAQVELSEGERSGLLTRAGFLASHAHSANGSPPLRGVFVTERLLCEPRSSPPASANTTPPVVVEGDAPRTNRELFEERTAPPLCQGCHLRMDGFGMGFEHYDATGAFRSLDQGFAVNASGNVYGTDVDGPYDGAIELSEVLADSELVQACATRQWLRYALGRAIEGADACLLDRLVDGFVASGGDVRELMVSIVASEEMRHASIAAD